MRMTKAVPQHLMLHCVWHCPHIFFGVIPTCHNYGCEYDVIPNPGVIITVSFTQLMLDAKTHERIKIENQTQNEKNEK